MHRRQQSLPPDNPSGRNLFNAVSDDLQMLKSSDFPWPWVAPLYHFTANDICAHPGGAGAAQLSLPCSLRASPQSALCA
eukprot:101910-Pleurochrysis_carterae.AAC.4